MTAEMYDLPPRQDPEPRRLYTAPDIATMLGVSRNWIHMQMPNGAPKPDFVAQVRGGKLWQLWTSQGVDRWRAFHASEMSIPNTTRFISFSDHNTSNRLPGGAKGGHVITWKLWWQCSHDGGATWWFSTPQGWYVSNDDGETWTNTGLQVRPGEYRYYSIVGDAVPKPYVARILRSSERLRKIIEKDMLSE